MNNRNMNKSILHTPDGVRDIYGEELRFRRDVQNRILSVMGSEGYSEIVTPVFEYFDVFSRDIGTTPSKELYKLFDREGETLALRPDFTPSVARSAARYFLNDSNTVLPLRFFYCGNTFNNSRPLLGRPSEVTQAGVELIGAGDAVSDAEVVSLLIRCLREAGLESFTVSLGNASYFRGLCGEAGLCEEDELSLRDHISGRNWFAAEDLLRELGTDTEIREKLLSVIDLSGDPSVLDTAAENAGNSLSEEAVNRLRETCRLVGDMGLSRYVSFDLGLLSRYNYYTGIVFRAYTFGVGEAVAMGGRYDRLLAKFGKDCPATGFAIVLDNVITALGKR